MDIEQLKLILATLHDAGTGALVFGLCYLAKDIVLALVICTGLGVVVFKVIQAIAAQVNKYEEEAKYHGQSEQSEAAVLERIATLAGCSRPLWLSDRAKVEAWLTKADAAIKNSTQGGR